MKGLSTKDRVLHDLFAGVFGSLKPQTTDHVRV